jgi:hypothetical protein
VSDDVGGCVVSLACGILFFALSLSVNTCMDRESDRNRLCAHIFRVEAQTASDTISLVNDYPCAMPRRKP